MKKRIPSSRLLVFCAMILATASMAHAQDSYRTEAEFVYSVG